MFRRDNYDPIEKPRRIKDPKLLQSIWTDRCEVCLLPFNEWRAMHRHHLSSRGAGGADSRENVLCCCSICHVKIHNGEISRETLLEIKKGGARKGN